MIEWKAVREAASRFLPKHTAAAAWKHRNLSHVEQEGLPPMPKDRGAERGDGSLALGMVEAETRGSIAAWQAAAPFLGSQADHAARSRASANFQLGGPEKLTHDPQHARVAEKRRLGGSRYMDDGDMMCHPILVMPFLQDFDVANGTH